MNKKEIVSELEQLKTLGEVVDSFEEIAVSTMRKIRSSVLYSRYFVKGLTAINQEVKASYAQEVQELMKKRKVKNPSKTLSLLKTNGKAISVLISPNTGLYGSIIKKTFNEFLQHVNTSETDIVIIGRLGRLMYEQQKEVRKYVFFDFPQSKYEKEVFQKVNQILIQYEKILVFYGLFENMSVQRPAILDVYGNVPNVTVASSTRTEYLFEPSLEKILLYFQQQIFASIFMQAVKESDLSRYASRILTLDAAAENIRERFKKYRILEETMRHRIMNKKQQESLAGMSLW